MKNLTALLIFFSLFLAASLSAQTIDKNKSYFHFGINGPWENGVFLLQEQEGSDYQIFHKVVSLPTAKIGDFGIFDQVNETSAIIKFPAEKGWWELSDFNRDKFILSITVNDRLFTSKTVSVHITELERDPHNPMRLKRVKGKFQGVMKHDYNEPNNSLQIKSWESKQAYFTVYGEFQYIAPNLTAEMKKKKKIK